jgi:hypothetical protein
MTTIVAPQKKVPSLKIKGSDNRKKKNVTILHERLGKQTKSRIGESILVHKPRDFVDVP